MQRAGTYKDLDVVSIPDDIPELDIEAGDRGTVVHVLDPGRAVSVEVVNDDGEVVAIVDLRVDGEPRVVGYIDERN